MTSSTTKRPALSIEIVREAMTRRGWSAAELARRARLEPSTVSRVLSGDRRLVRETAARLCAALELDDGIERFVARETYASVLTDLDIANTRIAALETELFTARAALVMVNSRLDQIRELSSRHRF